MKKKAALGNPQINLRIPDALLSALRNDASAISTDRQSPCSIQEVIIARLSELYGLHIAPPIRGRKPSKGC
jgi:hypothetical protein